MGTLYQMLKNSKRRKHIKEKSQESPTRGIYLNRHDHKRLQPKGHTGKGQKKPLRNRIQWQTIENIKKKRILQEQDPIYPRTNI